MPAAAPPLHPGAAVAAGFCGSSALVVPKERRPLLGNLLEPVLQSSTRLEGQWLDAMGGPPHVMSTPRQRRGTLEVFKEALDGAAGQQGGASSSSAAASVEGDAASGLTPTPPSAPPLPRQPRVPRMAAMRHSKLSGRSADSRRQLPPPSRGAMADMLYTREIVGKFNTNLWRGGLDDELALRDAEIFEQAVYRHERQRWAGEDERTKAVEWRSDQERLEQVFELGFQLALAHSGARPTSEARAAPSATTTRTPRQLPPLPEGLPVSEAKRAQEAPASRAPAPPPTPQDQRRSVALMPRLIDDDGAPKSRRRGPAEDGADGEKEKDKADAENPPPTPPDPGQATEAAGSAGRRFTQFQKAVLVTGFGGSMKKAKKTRKERDEAITELRRREAEARRGELKDNVKAEAVAMSVAKIKEERQGAKLPSPKTSVAPGAGGGGHGAKADEEATGFRALPLLDLFHELGALVRKSCKREDTDLTEHIVKDQEIDHIRRIFDTYDRDGSDSLDQAELRGCLAKLGLRARNQEERNEIQAMLRDWGRLDFSFEDLVKDVIPMIRWKLADLQSKRLQDLFRIGDADGSGRLCIEELIKALHTLGTFPGQDLVEEAIWEEVPGARKTLLKLDGVSLVMTRDVLDFEQFRRVFRRLQERTECDRMERFDEIVYTHELDESMQELWEHGLVELRDLFDAYTEADTSTVKVSHLATIARELGHLPKSSGNERMLNDYIKELRQDAIAGLDEDSVLDFRSILQILSRLRRLEESRIQQIYDKYDQDCVGLTLELCLKALEECDIVAQVKDEAQELEALIEEFDEDGSGEVDQQEFFHLTSFVRQHLHKKRLEAARKMANDYGLKEDFHMLRALFLERDDAQNAWLRPDQVRGLIMELRHGQFSEDELRHGAWSPQEVKVIMEEKHIEKVDFSALLFILKELDEFKANADLCQNSGIQQALNPQHGMISRDRLEKFLVQRRQESGAGGAGAGSGGVQGGSSGVECVGSHGSKISCQTTKTDMGAARKDMLEMVLGNDTKVDFKRFLGIMRGAW
mmetsp:Transcript_90086/g.291065  ORF Transcript_90086/g.291065 Transcript_90086/m.291065 type:complete len:1039 (-) Transcript_90086:227-3343(-)